MPDFGARKTCFTAESGQCRGRIRVQSVRTTERRCRFETGAGRAAEQRQDGRTAKIVHHYAIDGAEPATHCPTQRGTQLNQTIYPIQLEGNSF